LVRGVTEGALVLLLIPPLPKRGPLLLEELRRDPRALFGRDLDAVPRAVAGPLLVEESSLPERRREAHHAAAGDREHGPDRVVERVIDAGRLVNDEEPDSRETSDRFFRSRKRHDAGAVAELDAERRLLGDRDRLTESVPEVRHLPEQLLRLAEGRAQEKNERLRGEDELVEGHRRGH